MHSIGAMVFSIIAIAVAWYFGMPYETEEDLQKVRDKYMPLIKQIEDEE